MGGQAGGVTKLEACHYELFLPPKKGFKSLADLLLMALFLD
jgi:hypothetical protein